MSISKDALEQAFEEMMNKHKPGESADEIKTLDEIELSAIQFSDEMIQRAIELTLEEQQKKDGKKKDVKNVGES